MKKTLLVASIAFIFALPANAQYTTNYTTKKQPTSYTTQQKTNPVAPTTAKRPSFRPAEPNAATNSDVDDLPSFNAMNQRSKPGYAQPRTNNAFSGSSATQQRTAAATTAQQQPVQELVPPPKGEVLVYMTNYKVIDLLSGGKVCDFDVVVQNNTDQTLTSFGANLVLGKNEHLILMKKIPPTKFKIDKKRIQEPDCDAYQGRRPNGLKVRQCIIGATAGKPCVPYIKLK
ncbi:MAG: hypothetical protein MJ247_04515 [Alphaproteobacteria bacterium]|nr:hypothetical protein [Alphaproteobacteria bacterium]